MKLLFWAMALALPAATPAPPPYTVVRSIAGPDGGWDYASVDPAAGRLYIARGDAITVVDLAAPNAVRSVGTIAHGHAVVPIADLGLVLVTSGHDDSVRLLDRGGAQVARIAVGTDPDAALYDAAHHRAVVMNAKAGTVSVIDPATRTVTRTITLHPGLEFAQLAADGTLYVNNEDSAAIETADLATGTAGAPIALQGCEGPTGLAYDARTHWLVSACANGKAAVVDAVTRRQIALLPIGRGPDAVILDAARRLAFIPCGKSGTLAILSLAGAAPRVVATIATAPGARTGALDPRDGTLYLPTAQLAPPATPGARPQPVPGTFRVLVVQPAHG